MEAQRILVRGQVQGVFYRNWTVATAKRLGITGWVRNLRRGDVEILAIGNPAALEALVRECWEGPPSATVKDVLVTEVDSELLKDFTKRPTV